MIVAQVRGPSNLHPDNDLHPSNRYCDDLGAAKGWRGSTSFFLTHDTARLRETTVAPRAGAWIETILRVPIRPLGFAPCGQSRQGFLNCPLSIESKEGYRRPKRGRGSEEKQSPATRHITDLRLKTAAALPPASSEAAARNVEGKRVIQAKASQVGGNERPNMPWCFCFHVVRKIVPIGSIHSASRNRN